MNRPTCILKCHPAPELVLSGRDGQFRFRLQRNHRGTWQVPRDAVARYLAAVKSLAHELEGGESQRRQWYAETHPTLHYVC